MHQVRARPSNSAMVSAAAAVEVIDWREAVAPGQPGVGDEPGRYEP